MRSNLLRPAKSILQRPRSVRQLSSTSSRHAEPSEETSTKQVASIRRFPRALKRTALDEEELKWDLEDAEDEDARHMSSYGWDVYRQQREFFNVMRTLERDAPVLKAYRRPFHPPSPTHTPVLVRATTYAGEAGHPLTPKRTIVVPVALLPLKKSSSDVEAAALHNVKVLAGSRWTTEPPKDAGLPSWRHTPVYAADESAQTTKAKKGSASEEPEIGRHGYIKISCELFPETQMNLKWCMDTLRRLVSEANERAGSKVPGASFTDVPLPTRHIDSRLRAHGLGGGSFKADRKRVTLRDFPKEWLPKQ
ncbi:hypothetical protein M408DRAFT_331253 [Serendipita vermifera MAFF 305830]|uniref:Small ribosomal subunit protein mS35 mitochondrial conserved domain-containing protein n=1 Tax=Serendipita vermifera MAFF 305830 TaxID=933852 RepID=A0A0C3AL53_SERVB|nr:hypothetical protein M408DRAFT_331253 [Serendipita vermifera MAFF 305830]